MRLITFTALSTALIGCATSTPGSAPVTAGAGAIDSMAAASTITETVVAGPPTVLDHSGLGPVRIGASFAEVEATGLIGGRTSPQSHPCAYYDLKAPLRGSVVFDQDRTVSSVIVISGPGTTEGVGPADAPSRVPEVYPSAVPNEYGYLVPLDTGNTYGFYSIDGSVITTVDLRGAGQTCHE